MANNGATSGMSLGTVLFLIFLVMKLSHVGDVANWSWVWVTSPLWISAAIIVMTLVVFLVIALIMKDR